MHIYDFIQGLIIGSTLIIAIGPQNLFVINQGLKKSFVEAQLGDVEVTYANTQKLESTFGYSPKVGLSEGVSNFIKWFEFYHESTSS